MNDEHAQQLSYEPVVESDGRGSYSVEYEGLEVADFVSRALANLKHGYGCVPIGRVDPHRPDLPPHKVAWCRGYHGYNANSADASCISAMPAGIIRRMAIRGERGILNLAARLPPGVVGLDVDAYGAKAGGVTIAKHDQRLGRRRPTYFVTARGVGSGSGIYLYRTPNDWAGIGTLGPGVETIQSHLRYLAAPGSLHHTGQSYVLYHQNSGSQDLGLVLPAADDPSLAELPDAWLRALHRKPRRAGTDLDVDDIRAIASEWVFDEHPYMLDATVQAVCDATEDGTTRNAIHRALWIAARKSRAGCYPFSRAVVEIEAAAAASYSARGLQLDLIDFARSLQHAVREALDLSDAEVTAWGAWSGRDSAGELP